MNKLQAVHAYSEQAQVILSLKRMLVRWQKRTHTHTQAKRCREDAERNKSLQNVSHTRKFRHDSTISAVFECDER